MAVKAAILAAGCALSLNVNAGTMGPMEDCHPWALNAGLGYTWYDFGYKNGITADPFAQHAIGDGQTALGRFSISRELMPMHFFRLGLELGVQSGNTMRLRIPQVALDTLGGLPIQTTIKPMLDLLAVATTDSLVQTSAFGIVKAGVAYRRLQVNERVTVNDLSQAAFEVQAGLGIHLSQHANLSLLYQGVFSGNTHFTVDAINAIGHISNIPQQNGILLNVSYQL